jgi:hypothetical protein
LQRFGFSDGMRSEQVMDCVVAGHEGKAVGEFESFLAQSASLPDSCHTEGGFID